MKRLLAITLTCLAISAGQADAAPQDQAVFSDFESFNPNTAFGASFSIGSSPEKATFGGDGFAGAVGNFSLYNSGVRAWMIVENGTGSVDFETNAATVEFMTRLIDGANGSSVYTAYDDANQVIDSVTIDTPGAFQLVSFTGNIDRLEIVNNATGAGQMNSIDDFGFTAIPEPSSLVLGLGAVAGIFMNRRPRNR